MAIYRTAQGKAIDMSALAGRNERVRAVGNMNVNARGDTIDSHGRIVVPVTKKVGDGYQKTIANRAANIVKRKEETLQPIETASAPEAKIDMSDEIALLAQDDDFGDEAEAAEIEAIKAAESNDDQIIIKPASEAPEFFAPEPKKIKK